MNLTHLEKKACKEIIAVTINKLENRSRIAAMSWQELFTNLSTPAQSFADKIRNINTEQFDIQREPKEPVRPSDLVTVRNQTYTTTTDKHSLPPRLLPTRTLRAFQDMNKALQQDIGRKLVIQSGYRSPAYQLYIFLYNLEKNDWNFDATLQRVALPGYSEHATKSSAIDVRAKRHIGPHETYEFNRTPEYRWLRNNGRRFGFSLSYPKNNDTGTKFEPWHWRHFHPAA
jgi:D-alanyl-D-alanine carboxypeptidase